MKSGYKVEWSDEAITQLSKIYDYLEQNWTGREIRKFSVRLERVIELIAQYPRMFAVSQHKKKVRRCILTKQNSLYYKVDRHRIFIVTLFDNRQDPKKLKLP